MIYKVLVTTIATRSEAISVDATVIEFDERSDAKRAVDNINTDQENYGRNRYYDQKALPLNFIGDH